MSKSKEEILNEAHWKYVTEKGISSIHTELFPGAYKEQAEIAMDIFAKSQCIAFVKWKDDRGYLPFQKPDSTTPEWGWKRQENQIIWSKWINDDQLYDLFIQHQNRQQ